MPSWRRARLALAAGTWPLRGPAQATSGANEPELVTTVFWTAFGAAMALGAISVVALVLRFRHAGAMLRQQIKWFAYGAAPSVPLGMFAQARPLDPYLELLGAAVQLAGVVLTLGLLSGGIGTRTPPVGTKRSTCSRWPAPPRSPTATTCPRPATAR